MLENIKNHPNPQFARKNWQSLNGNWEFRFDFQNSGLEKDWQKEKSFEDEIIVPFCPESILSKVGYTDFIPAIWYLYTLPIDKKDNNERILIHFGAVDFEATLYVNGNKAGTHKGGYTPFTFDITDELQIGDNKLILHVLDDTRSNKQATGKQSPEYKSHNCVYTRTTGIWQTVYIERVPKTHIDSLIFYTDPLNSCFDISFNIKNIIKESKITIKTLFEGKEVSKVTKNINQAQSLVHIDLEECHLWDINSPNLYDLICTLNTPYGEDTVYTYMGMRHIFFDDKKFMLNGKSVFQRLVLDQGYYEDGIYTAPNDDTLKQDIILAKELGFNGARLHEKVFDPRYLYWADKLGFIVWGEYPNWGLNHSDYSIFHNILREWKEAMLRDINHPSIVGWCPFNETWDRNGHKQDDRILYDTYLLTKQIDKTRPCIDTSGNYHVITDVFDIHDYEQDASLLKEKMDKSNGIHITFKERQTYNNEPYMVSEFGGIGYYEEADNSWGYGNSAKTEEEFLSRYSGLIDTLLQNENIFGFCYTQLYDVEQEKNGILDYKRNFKFKSFSIKDIYNINTKPAAIEK